MIRHTGSNPVNSMFMEYHRHPFGENHLAGMSVVQELPAGFQSEKRLDYGDRTDDKPVYVAFSEYVFTTATDTITPATTGVWIVQKFTYDDSNRVTRIQVARGAWDSRTELFT